MRPKIWGVGLAVRPTVWGGASSEAYSLGVGLAVRPTVWGWG